MMYKTIQLPIQANEGITKEVLKIDIEKLKDKNIRSVRCSVYLNLEMNYFCSE